MTTAAPDAATTAIHAAPLHRYRNAETGCEVLVWLDGTTYTVQLANPMGFATGHISCGTDLAELLAEMQVIAYDGWIAPYQDDDAEPVVYRATCRMIDHAGNERPFPFTREFDSYERAGDWLENAIDHDLGNTGSIHRHVPGFGWLLAD